MKYKPDDIVLANASWNRPPTKYIVRYTDDYVYIYSDVVGNRGMIIIMKLDCARSSLIRELYL